MATRIGGWLPPVPSDDPGPPDIDGKRPSEVGSRDVLRVQANQKNGKGGYR